MSRLIKGLPVFLVALLLAACEGQLSDVEHVEKAQAYMDKGDLLAASVELKNAIQSNPENPQARWLLGKLQLDIGDAAGAEKELRRASDLGVAAESVFPLLARALLLQGDSEALFQLSVDQITSPVQRAEVLAAQGLGHLSRGESADAGELIAAAISLAPESSYAVVANARLLAVRKETSKARSEVESLLENQPEYAPAWTLLAELEVLDKQWAKADAAYTESIKNRRDKRLDMLSRALIRIELGRYDEAQADIDALRKQIPNDVMLNYAQGLIHFQNGGLQDAKAAFQVALRGNDAHAMTLYYLGLTHLKLGSLEQAQEFNDRYLARAPGSVPGRKVAAILALKERKFEEAERLILPVVKYLDEDVDALNLLATAFMGQAKFDQALELLAKVTELQSDSAAAQVNYGKAMLQAGKKEEGVARVEQALRLDPDYSQGYMILIVYYLDEGQMEDARAIASRQRDRFPDSPLAWNLLGRLDLFRGDFEAARQAFGKVLALSPGDVLANFSLAAVAVKAKDYDAARGYYQDVLQDRPNHLGSLLNLATLDAMEGKEEQLAERLQLAVELYPRERQPVVMLARYHFVKGQPGKIPPLLLNLGDEQKGHPEVLEIQALSQIAQQQYSEARYSLESLLKARPKEAPLHFLLSRVQAALGNRVKAIDELEKTLDLDPDHFAARLARTNLAIRKREIQQARQGFAVLERLAPTDPRVLQLKAALSQLEGDPATASIILEEAFEESPDTSTLLAFARQKWLVGGGQIELDLEERWVKDHPEDVPASLALAGFYTRLGEVDKAIAMYRQVLQHSEGNMVALNDLAWLLQDRRPKEALNFALRARELAPQSAGVLDTLAMVQLRNGEIELARRSIERAMRAAPENLSIRYNGAEIAYAAGDRFDASEILEDLLGRAADFPEKEQAEKLLQDIVSNEDRP